MSETSNYSSNLKDFTDLMKNAFIEKLIYDEDSNPTFDKESLLFDFKYCHSVTFYTNKGNFLLQTSMTTSGLETFWILPADNSESLGIVKLINSNVISISIKNGYDELPFKLSMIVDDYELSFYAADVHDKLGGAVNYKINDEMILAFEDTKEASKFESLINCA